LAAFAGLCIGAAALTRSIGYFLPIVWLAGMAAKRVRLRVILAEVALLLAVEHGVMLPWALHNATASGRFTFLGNLGGVGLFIGNNPHATGGWYVWTSDLEHARPGVFARGPMAVDEAARQEALRWIRENPGRAARLYFKKLWIILSDDTSIAGWALYGKGISPPEPGIDVLPSSHFAWRHQRTVLRVLRAADLLLLASGLGGLVLLFLRERHGRHEDLALAVGILAAIAYVPLFSAPIAVNGRYRWPSEDVSLPLAALFVTSRKSLRSGRSGDWISSAATPDSNKSSE